MISKHDELLLRDLKLQPLWLLWLYVALGVLAVVSALLRTGLSLRPRFSPLPTTSSFDFGASPAGTWSFFTPSGVSSLSP